MEAYSDQRRKTHDFQNQLAIIYGLAQQESPDSQVLNYVRPLLKKEMLPTLITKTGRNVVDILLTQKYSVAIKNQILFQMQLGDLSDFPLSDEELIVVLSNLLDNALNACMDISNSKERRILLKMRTKEAAGFLYLENPTAHNVEILDNKIVPSKTTSIEHGYGLKNVTAILDNIGALYVLSKKFYRFSDYLGTTSQMSELLGISSISGILRFGRYPAYHGISEPHLAVKSSKTVVENRPYY